VSTSPNERTPNTSRSLKALRALGIRGAGVRATKATGQQAWAELPPPTPPAHLGQLEPIGYQHGAARTAAELRTIVVLGWIDLDHWIATELAAAMRTAARCLNGVSMALAPTEARQLAHGAALARIDVLRAQSDRRKAKREHPSASMPLRAAAGPHLGFHGGC
jgi:hypothetical protein